MSTAYEQPPVTHVEYSPTPPPPQPRRSRTGWLVAAIILAFVLVGVVAWYGPFGSPSAAVQAQPQGDSQVVAVQSVIERGNSEQAQALNTQDPSVMSDTATAGYYQQLVQTNQSLLGDGVTSIALTDLTWGPIS